MMNLYDVLSIAPEANEAEVKAAFRQLAKAFHPDVSGGDRWCEQQFKAINHACRIVGDAVKRRVYDAELANARSRARGRLWCGVATMVMAFLVTVGAGAIIMLFGQNASMVEVHAGLEQPALDNTVGKSLPVSASATG